MEGYLVRIPTDAWLGDSGGAHAQHKRTVHRHHGRHAQLLYYELGEGYLRGYASPDDTTPVHEFQLTSFHVEVDAMYSMLMFQVFATSKTPGAAALTAAKGSKAGDDSSDDDSSSDDDRSDDGDADDAAIREPSVLLFAANKALVQTWATRLLNWNRYVFGSSANSSDAEPNAEMLDASRCELLAAFESHCCASWFSRALALDAHPSRPVTDKRDMSGVSSRTDDDDATRIDTVADKTSAATALPSRPWWTTFGRSETRRISASSMRK